MPLFFCCDLSGLNVDPFNFFYFYDWSHDTHFDRFQIRLGLVYPCNGMILG